MKRIVNYIILAHKPLQRIDYDMSKYDWDVIAGQVGQVYASIGELFRHEDRRF